MKPLLRDDFARAKPDVWEIKAGKWAYQGGKLVQQQDGSRRAVLRLKQPAPTDFEARVRFTILGGQMWKSVGLAFDVAGTGEVLVYLSAWTGGPKLQISYKQVGSDVYPGDGMQARAVKVNEPQEMTVRVRGTLINVAVNGQHALAYRLPVPRRPGHAELITFDARAAFTAFELTALPPEVRLVEAGKPGMAVAPQTLAQARLTVGVAEKALAAAEAEPAALKARFAADRARHRQPPVANAAELAKRAACAERQAALAAAEETVTRAELELARAGGKTPAAAQKLTAARVALAKARKDLEKPGNKYTPLRGALKTLESNLESEALRSKPFPTISTGRRSALAKWMTDARNPLTARVAVNHIWARHFGKPLVATVFDFGRKGAPPTHPALLDWLAVEFMESGWSMKHLHRLLVTSKTYRLSSSAAGAVPADRVSDPENRWYWRMNPLRMEAEVIRDSLLYLAGDLELTGGGPPLPVNALSRRRSLYFVHSHNDHQKFLAMFDNASVLECYRRAESIVPQQALALENSGLALAAAEKVALRLSEQLGKASDAAFIRAAFETVLGSPPTAAEQAACERALKEMKTLAGGDKMPGAALRRGRTWFTLC